MPLTAVQFVYPRGRLRSAAFPGENLLESVDIWLTDSSAILTALGVTLAQLEPIVELRVYWIAYRGRCDALPESGIKERDGDVTTEYSEKERSSACVNAADYRAQYRRALEGLGITDPALTEPDSSIPGPFFAEWRNCE